MKKLLTFLMVGILLLTTACGGADNSASNGTAGGNSASSGDTIELGAMYPFTGAAALLGDESFRGAEIAIELRNQNGGVNGKQVSIVKTDAPDANAAQAEANRLVNQRGLNLIFGSYSSSIAFAASEVTERNGAIYWEMGGISDPITERGYKNIFRTNAPASEFARAQVDFINEVVGEKLGKDAKDLRIVIAHEDALYGTTVAEYVQNFVKEAGLNLVSVQSYDGTSNDLTSILLNIKNANPDVLIAVSNLNDAILLSRQAKELGLKVPVFLGSGGGHTMSDFQAALGADANGILNVDFPQYEINREFTPGLEDFLALYQEKYGSEPRSGHSLTNFMGMNVLLDVLEATGGEVDPEKIREAALAFKLAPGHSATGWGVEFDPETGQNILAKAYVHQWVDGKLAVVWPQELAVQEAQIPLE